MAELPGERDDVSGEVDLCGVEVPGVAAESVRTRSSAETSRRVRSDADLTPVWLITGQHGPADLDRTAVQRLTLAIAAVLARDRHPRRSGPTTGTCTLAAGHQGTYTLPPH